MPDSVLEVQGLTCRYGSFTAVHDLGFCVRRGEVLGLLGPNGAGKSSTMDAICGIRPAALGTVRLGGIDLARDPLGFKSRLGYLPERAPLYPELTVCEYLGFCARLRGVVRRREALARALRACALETVAGRRIGTLSRGFQQRVGLAQAILHDPDLFVLDEPTVGLDPNQICEIRRLVAGLGERGAVILSTHVLSEVEEVCDRVIILDRGRLAASAEIGVDEPDSAPARLRVRLGGTGAESGAIRRLDGVLEVEALGPGEFGLRCSDRERATRALLGAALEQGWDVRHLSSAAPSLEERFVAATAADPTDDLPR